MGLGYQGCHRSLQTYIHRRAHCQLAAAARTSATHVSVATKKTTTQSNNAKYTATCYRVQNNTVDTAVLLPQSDIELRFKNYGL